MSRLKDLMVEIGFDVSDVEKGIGKLSKQFDNLGKEFVKKTVKSIPKDPFNIGAERTRTQKFIKELKDLGQEVGSYQKKLKTLKTPEQFKEFRGELKQYKKDYFEFQDAVSEKQLKNLKENIQREEDLKKKSIETQRAKKRAIKKAQEAQDKADKKAQEAQDKLLKRARRLEEQLRFSANFRRLPDTEKNRFEGQIKSARKLMVTKGSDYGFRKLSSDVREFRRSLIGLHTVQMGLTDSARNMLRAYASVFALVESTTTIERIGMDFQGMEVAMLASAGTAQKASKDLEFVRDIAEEMGVNLKDTTDAYVKLQFATKGKMDDSQVKELFFNLNRFATSLKVAPESLKLAQRAIQQIKFAVCLHGDM